MTMHLRSMVGFAAIVLLACAASAQIFAEDSAPFPELFSGDPVPDEFAAFTDGLIGAPTPELDVETGILGSNVPFTPDLNTSAPLTSDATGEESTDETELSYVDAPRLGAVCSLVIKWPNARSSKTCSGWILGDRYIATAGHCLYDRSLGGFPGKNPQDIKVYCTGNAGCKGRVTTTYSKITIAGNWNGNPELSNPWDVGIIKTQNSLPYRPLTWGTRTGYQTNVWVSGYPGQERSTPNSPCQRYSGYTGCSQFVSFGSLSGQVKSGYFRPDIDTCQGDSGGPMFDRARNWVTGILTGGSYNPCNNFVVPLRVGGVDRGCNHPEGGVDLNCLIAAAQ